MQAVEDLRQRQRPNPRRGKLDRQRHPIESPADLRYQRGIASPTTKSGRARRARSANNSIASSVSESDGTRQLSSPGTPSGSRLVARIVKCGEAASRFDGHRSRTHRADAHNCRAAAISPSRRRTVRADSMVERPGWSGSPSVRPGHRHHFRDGDRCEVDIPRAIGEGAADRGGHFHTEPSLSGAAGSGQRHQTIGGDDFPQFIHLRVAANETRQLGRKILRRNGGADTRSGGNSLLRSG